MTDEQDTISKGQIIKNVLAIGLGLTIIAFNNIKGHYDPPFSIESTPWLLTIVIAGVNYPLYKTNFSATVFYGFGLLIINDFLIRLYAGGTHDDEGKAWIFLSFALTFILSLISMLTYLAVVDSKESKKFNVSMVFLGACMTGLFYCVLKDI